MAVLDQIISLTKQLLPSGRAFKVPIGGFLEKLLNGLHASEARAYADAVSILDSALPDNNNFTVTDCSDWEKRLGLITNPLVSLSDRKLAIKRKMAHPGLVLGRQNYLYLQGQLRAAGFDVYVYENRFADYFAGYITKTPTQFSIPVYPIISSQYGQINYGQKNYGGQYGNRVINSIDENLDLGFSTGPTFRSTFFIGGPTPGSWATVDANRKKEFRQLILRLKPTQMVAYLLCNFS